MVTIIGLFLCVGSLGQAISNTPRDPVATEFLTGPRFQVELDQSLTGAWVNIELRPLLNKLAGQRRVAILLDRRIDPTVRLPINIVNRPLKEGLQEIARKMSAEISFPENVVYIGPPAAVSRLRTLMELRFSELLAKSNPVPDRRRSELVRRHSVSWDDLDAPADILHQIAEHWHLTIRNPELVTHDLWGGCRLPSVTAVEALTMVLIQFDLTFSWEDAGRGIVLVAIPDRVVVERRPRFKGRSATDMLKQIREHHANLDARLDGAELVVTGSLEDQEAVGALLNPSSVKKSSAATTAPLRKQVFSDIKFVRVPVKEFMKYLEKEHVVFVYDSQELSSAGIDLNQEIDVQLTRATADELLQAVFSPLKLSFEIDNLSVKLTPKK